MLRQFPDHPILHDFKHDQYQFDLTVIWPYGAGGHFLLNKLTHSMVNKSALNEYGNLTEIWNNLDHDGFGSIDDNDSTIEACLSTAYVTAKTGVMASQYNCFKQNNTPCILVGHRLPLLFGNVYNYCTNELIIVKVDPKHAWITKILADIKHKFAQTVNVYSIVDIVNAYYYNKLNVRVIAENIINVASIIQPYIPKFDISNAQVTFEYYFWLLRNNLPPSIGSFKQYIYSDIVCSMYRNELYTEDGLADVSKYANITHILDYIDLFFKGKIPDTCALSSINVSDIKIYSLENLELLSMFANLLPSEYQEKMHNAIAQLHEIAS